MVMKPEVWGPALDDVAACTTGGTELDSAMPHLDRLRHDELEGIEGHSYANSGEDSSLPLLLVPTPTGKPFTQDDAREIGRASCRKDRRGEEEESHIIE